MYSGTGGVTDLSKADEENAMVVWDVCFLKNVQV
jgi:hypothetical protein